MGHTYSSDSSDDDGYLRLNHYGYREREQVNFKTKIADFKVPPIFESFCKAEDLIWDVNSDNLEQNMAQIVKMLNDKEIGPEFAAKIITQASRKRVLTTELYKSLYEAVQAYRNTYEAVSKEFFNSHIPIKECFLNDDVAALKEYRETNDLNDQSLMYTAIETGAVNCYKYLRKEGVKVMILNLDLAIQGGNLEIIQDIYKKHVKKFGDPSLDPYLKGTIEYHRNDLFDWILEKSGESITVPIDRPYTLYQTYANLRMALMALELMNSARSVYNYKMAFLEIIVESGSKEKIDEFIKYYKIDESDFCDTIYMPNERNQRKFKTATGFGEATYVIENTAIYNWKSSGAMAAAVLTRDIEIVQHLIDLHCSVDGQETFSPLGLAIKLKLSDIANLLIENEAYTLAYWIHKKRKYEMFMWALKNDMFDVAETLTLHGASAFKRISMNSRYENQGETLTPLMMCCKKGQLNLVKWCIAQDVDVNFKFQKKTNYYMSALKYACKFGHLDVVKYLVETEHCDVNEMHTNRNYCFNTPLTHSIESGNIELIKYLIDQHARLDIKLKEVEDSRRKETISYVDFAKNRKCDESIIELLTTYKPPPKQLYNGILELSIPTHYHC